MRHWRILFVGTALSADTTEAPQWRHRQRGRIPDKADGLSRHGDSPLYVLSSPTRCRSMACMSVKAVITASLMCCPERQSLTPPRRHCARQFRSLAYLPRRFTLRLR
jgi:hypothetical protein